MTRNGYVESHEEIGQVSILTINLDAEQKYQKRNDKTPKRKKLVVVYIVYDRDDDDGIFVDVNSFNKICTLQLYIETKFIVY